jgi:hypothetical protein
MPTYASGYAPAVPDQALWLWDTSGEVPVVSGYPVGISTAYPSGYAPTKTGVSPADLQAYVGVPLVYYGNPPTPVLPATIQQWIRWAEDKVEQETTILLCQTWVASPPALDQQIANSVGLITKNGNGQQLGYDYDLEDNAYDFNFARAQDAGWTYLTLRYRPVQSTTYNKIGVSGTPATQGITAIKSMSFIYPLLNEYFRVPPPWFVEDRNYGYIRLVPATNVQMLPLWAMQLAFMGFNENTPGGIWVNYTAGLTALDYASHYSFMKELVLAEASITALSAIQGTLNLGAESYSMAVDGMQYKTTYFKNGPFGPLISNFEKRRERLMKMAQSKVAGPMLGSL